MAPSKRSKHSKRAHRASHSKRSKRAHRSKRSKRSHRSKRSKRAHRSKRSKLHTRRRGGSHALHGAPVGYSLAGDWSSQRSMGHGGDYLKYHGGQHGGALGGAPLSAIGSALPDHLQGSAQVAGTLAALKQIAHLSDQAGGKRFKRSKRSKRSRGGSHLHGAPLNAPSMLLKGGELAAAGLSPEWVRSVESGAAHARQGF